MNPASLDPHSAQQTSYSRTGRLRHSFHLGPGWSQAIKAQAANNQSHLNSTHHLDGGSVYPEENNYWLCNPSNTSHRLRSYSVSNELPYYCNRFANTGQPSDTPQRHLPSPYPQAPRNRHSNYTNVPLTPFNGQSRPIECRPQNQLVCLPNPPSSSTVNSNSNPKSSRPPLQRPNSLHLTSSLTSSSPESQQSFTNPASHRQSRSPLKRSQSAKQYADSILIRDLDPIHPENRPHGQHPAVAAAASVDHFRTGRAEDRSKIHPKASTTISAVQANRVVPTGLPPSRLAVTANTNYNAHLKNSQNELVEIIENYNHGLSTASAAEAVGQQQQQQQQNRSSNHPGTQSTSLSHQQLTSQLSNKSLHHRTDDEFKQGLPQQQSSFKENSHQRAGKHRSSDGNQIDQCSINNSLDASDQGDTELAYSIKEKYRDCTTNTNGIVFGSRDRGSIHRNNSRKSTASIDKQRLGAAPDQPPSKQPVGGRGSLLNTATPSGLPGSGISSSGYSSASRLYKSNLDKDLLPPLSVDASAEDLLIDDEELGGLI